MLHLSANHFVAAASWEHVTFFRRFKTPLIGYLQDKMELSKMVTLLRSGSFTIASGYKVSPVVIVIPSDSFSLQVELLARTGGGTLAGTSFAEVT